MPRDLATRLFFERQGKKEHAGISSCFIQLRLNRKAEGGGEIPENNVDGWTGFYLST